MNKKEILREFSILLSGLLVMLGAMQIYSSVYTQNTSGFLMGIVQVAVGFFISMKSKGKTKKKKVDVGEGILIGSDT